MRTTGLGGDSEVHVIDEGLQGGVTLGPRRVLPVSLIAHEAGELVHHELDQQLRSDTPGEYDARFVRAIPGMEAGGLQERDAVLLDRIGASVHPVAKVLRTRMEAAGLRRLVARGLVQVSGVTPSDASHLLGTLSTWDRDAAEKALTLLARKRNGAGNRVAKGPEALAQMIVDRLTYQTSLALLETAFAEEEAGFGLPPADLARHVLTQRGLDGHRGLIRLEAGLDVPVIGLGASAGTYYPAVGQRLGCRMDLPEHAGVANAIGAVVGRVTIRRSGTVTAPSEGRYRVHLESGPEDYSNADEAIAALQKALTREARKGAVAAGAEDISIAVRREIRRAEAEAREVFLEAEITVEANGRPRIAE